MKKPSASSRTSRPSSIGDEQLAAVLERINDGVVAFDAQMNYTYVNKRGGELLGRKPEDLIGKNYWQEYPEAAGTPFAKAYERALETQQLTIVEDYYAPWERWFENRIYPSPEGLIVFFSEVTERKRAEAELQASEKRFRATFEQAAVGIAHVGIDGSWLLVNQRLCEIVGYSRTELLERTFQDITHPDDLDADLAYVRQMLANEIQTYSMEKRYFHKDGSLIWINLTVSLVRDSSGAPDYFISVVEDITERVRAEEALRQSEQKFALMFEKAPFAASLSSLPEGRIVQVNEAFEHLSGYSREEAAGKTTTELGMYPDSKARARAIAQIQEREFVRDIELKLRTKSGEMRVLLVNTDYVEIGGERHVLTTAQDITERSRAEQALQRNEQVLRLFVEYSPAAIAMFDRDMKYIVASRRYLADYELGDQEIVGRSHYDLFPEIPERWKEIHRRCLGGAVERAEEDPFRRQDGRLDWVRWEIRPWYEQEGEIGGIILFSEVITERKQAQEALRRSRDRLRRLTARLTEVEADERSKLARELHDRVGQTLTALNINLNVVRSQLSADSAKQLGTRIEESLHLVSEAMARIRNVMADLHPPVLADYGLGAALSWYAGQFTQRTEIPVDVEEVGETGARFPVHLEIVLFRVAQEALTNVARHAGSAEVRITLETSPEAARLTVQDNGRGFEPQAVAPRAQGAWGVLTMRERVKAVGGTFELRATPGAGTTIIAEIPDSPPATEKHEEVKR